MKLAATPEWVSAWGAENRALCDLMFDPSTENVQRAAEATRQRVLIEQRDALADQAEAARQAQADQTIRLRQQQIEQEFQWMNPA